MCNKYLDFFVVILFFTLSIGDFMKKIILCFLLVFISHFSFTAANYTWSCYVQPFEGTTFLLDGKKVTPKIISKDNTKYNVSFSLKNKNASLQVSHVGYKNYNAEIDLSKKDNYIFLDKVNSTFSFYKYIKTGSQPKSVTFISTDVISAPLLNSNGADIINIHTGKTVRVTPPTFANKKGFVESLVLAHKNEVWISQMQANKIHVFSTTDYKHIVTIPTTADWGKVLKYDSKRNKVYFSAWSGRKICVINPDTYKEEKSFSAHGYPRGMSMSEDCSGLYICQYGLNSDEDMRGIILKVNPENGKILKRIGVPGAKRHIVLDKKHGYVIVSDMAASTIEIYNDKDTKLVKKIKVYKKPNTIVLSPDCSKLYVSSRGPNNPKTYYLKGFNMGRLSIIDMENLTKTEEWEGGNQCTGLDISPDGNFLVVSDFLDDAIRVYKKN